MSASAMAGTGPRGIARLAFVFLLAPAWAAAQNNCIDCHGTLDDEDLDHPTTAMAEDVHAAAGLGCADCHGGDPALTVVDGDYDPAKAPETGFVGAPSPTEIPVFCGRCHGDARYMQRFDPNLPVDQLAQYWTSQHGQRLREGDRNVAHCVSCHGAHGILASRDPRAPVYPVHMANTCARCHSSEEHMAGSDLPLDQLDQYRSSVHGRALHENGDIGAPTCNTCHGNHGATPPEVRSVSLVCGRCHVVQRELFAESPHRTAFAEIGEPECETCHGNHEVAPATDRLLGVDEEAICADCHFEDEAPYDVARSLRRDVDDLKAAIAHASATVRSAAIAGMEVSDAELSLIDANEALVQARNAVHAVTIDILKEHTDVGRSHAGAALSRGLAALDELRFRRAGLAVSVFFLLLVAVALHFKIRRMEARK